MVRPPHELMSANVLYLDFDGVLHRNLTLLQSRRGQTVNLFEFADRLATVLEPYPEVRIVLSTSWVFAGGFRRCIAYLPAPLRPRIIGATYDSTTPLLPFADLSRWRQIIFDVERRRPRAWVAIDDDVANCPPEFADHFVDVPGRCGLGCGAALDRLESALVHHFGPGLSCSGGNV
jgi:hypothetical protein